MSQASGTLTPPKPLHVDLTEWTDLTKMSHTAFKSLFELADDSYATIRSYFKHAPKDRHKFYFAITELGLFVIKHNLLDGAIHLSKQGDVPPEMLDPEGGGGEIEARKYETGANALFDCGTFAVGLVLGVYTGGAFLAIAGIGAGAKCLSSAVKLYDATNEQESRMDSPLGKTFDTTVNVITIATDVKSVMKSSTSMIGSWRRVRTSISPRIRDYSRRRMLIDSVKLTIVDLPGIEFSGDDLLESYHGTWLPGSRLREVLEAAAARPSPTPVPWECVCRPPADWLRDELQRQFSMAMPWECGP